MQVKLLFSIQLCLAVVNFVSSQDYDWVLQHSEVKPHPISNQDSVKIIYDYLWGSAECKLDSSQVLFAGNDQISIDAYYAPGDAAAMCPGQDSIIIGILPSGSYLAVLTLHHVLEEYYVEDTLYFTVEGEVSASGKVDNVGINIYPNPAQSEVVIQGIREEMHFRLVNYLGTEVYSANLRNDRALDLSILARGIYFLLVYDAHNELIYSEKIVLQ